MIIGKFLLGLISILLFIIFVVLMTVRFELLNKSFLFGSFEKHKVYAQLPTLLADSLPNDPNLSEEEKIVYSEFIRKISPKDVKPLIEKNLAQVIDYLNGQSQDVVLSFSLPGVGFENTSGIRWSISQIPDKNLRNNIRILNETGNTLIIAAFAVLTILIGIIILYGRGIILIIGAFTAILSLIIKFILMVIGSELVKGQEPSQKLLGLLSSSFFPEVTTTWLVGGIALISFWLFLFFKFPPKDNG